MKRLLTHTLFAAAVAFAAVPARAQSDTRADTHGSNISRLSMLPIGVSVAATGLLLSGAATLTIVSVQASASGTEWLLERASDGARFSVTLSAAAAEGVSVAAGTVVSCVAIGTGWVLSAAGQAIAFIPNAVGAALLHNERVTQ